MPQKNDGQHRWRIGGEDPEKRLMDSIRWQAHRRYTPEDTAPTPFQVAMVLHALADHTTVLDALGRGPHRDTEAVATTIGRWLHAYGDYLDRTRTRRTHES